MDKQAMIEQLLNEGRIDEDVASELAEMSEAEVARLYGFGPDATYDEEAPVHDEAELQDDADLDARFAADYDPVEIEFDEAPQEPATKTRPRRTKADPNVAPDPNQPPRKTKAEHDAEEQAAFEAALIEAGLAPKTRREDLPTELIPLANLPEGNGGRYPQSNFVDSIRRNGVIHPIVVRVKRGSGNRATKNYEVVDGWQRLVAARQSGIPALKAVVIPDTGDAALNSDVVTLTSNNLRSMNVVEEFQALERMMAQHDNDLKLVSKATGVPVQTLNRRWILKRLKPELFQALADGKMGRWSAETLARYPDEPQERAIEILREKGSLSTQDAVSVRRANVKAAVEAAGDGDLFDAPDLDGDEGSDDGAADTAKALAKGVKKMANATDRVRGAAAVATADNWRNLVREAIKAIETACDLAPDADEYIAEDVRTLAVDIMRQMNGKH